MQDWKDSGLEGYGKEGILERRDTGKEGSGQEVCKTGEMLDRRPEKGYRKGGMQDRWDAGLEST